jgi:nucleoside-diphosphate-sugar epimerase
MKVLVIGGNRFFGKRLVEKLSRQHVDLTVMNRTGPGQGTPANVKHIILDRRTLKRHHPELSGKTWDIIYDQVCYDAPEAESAIEAFDGKVGKYVFTSTLSVYDSGANIYESAFDPRSHRIVFGTKPILNYAEAKRDAEAVFFQKAPFSVVAVRFPFVLGEDDYTERLKFHVQCVLNEKPIHFPNPKARVSMIHAADAARFLGLLEQRDFFGPVNCAATDPISMNELIHMIGAKAGRIGQLATIESEGESSPYGKESDWFMNTDLQKKLGYECLPITEWLPVLIGRLLPKDEPHD